MTNGRVIQFRRGVNTIRERHFIIEPEGVKDRKEASQLIGKIVEWKSPAGKIIKGKITAAHGTKGLVRVVFERGLPGQALITKVEIK
ncbi:MAG: 50S ribosomal protein L35ae [Candidatus Pacearchaeota archaeon]|jgi:large subunit ribosomal protein L35Ae